MPHRPPKNAPTQVTQWLLTQNWDALGRHFASHRPTHADEYHARALMHVSQAGGAIDWDTAISDLRQACALKPTEMLFSVNLIQALLDSRRTHEAYETAKHSINLYPNAYPVLEKHAFAAVATQRWAEALDVLQHAQEVLGHNQSLPQNAAFLLTELSLRWWEPIVKAGVVLRCPEILDKSFLSSTFRDEEFMKHYHRFQGASDEEVERFISNSQLSPRQSRRIDWIILDRSGNRVGLAGIVDIDWSNDRGELLIGLPGTPVNMVSLKASVAALEFAFNHLHMAKMISYVYGDNPVAQANTLHLGFEQEGLLRSHIASHSGRLDLFVNGMTSASFANNALLNKLSCRWSD